MNDRAYIDLWIGDNFSSDEEYKDYFERKGEMNVLQLEVGACQFCVDIGEVIHDPDQLILPQRFSTQKDILSILEIIKVNEEEKEKITQECTRLGINKANAVFWYVNSNLSIALAIQKPYKESYNGLKYIGSFIADSVYEAVDNTVPLTPQHLWIGTNMSPKKEYDEYFKIDYSTDSIDDPDYKICGFCQDIGTNWYDEDFIGYPRPLKKEVPVKKLIEKLLGSLDCEDEIIKKCHELGIEKANALFWYEATETEIKQPYKESYNGLKYIGIFGF